MAASNHGAPHSAIVTTLIMTAKLKGGRPLGVADRRARAHGLRADQGPRARALLPRTWKACQLAAAANS